MPQNQEFIEIDGAYGEGGGQIIRTALMFSSLSGKAIHVSRVRGKRRRPGILAQHQAIIQAVARITQAETKGTSLGSIEFWFQPKRVSGDNYSFNVSQLKHSVGAINFVMQTLLPSLLFCGRPCRLNIKGATHIPLSPSHEFIEWAFIPFLSALGVRMRATFNRPGFIPSGNGEVDYSIEPLNRTLKPMTHTERGVLNGIKFTAITSGLDGSVLERMVQIGSERISGRGVEVEVIPRHYPGPDKASFAGFCVHFASVNAAFCTLGKADDDPITITTEAAARLISFLGNRCVVEEHLADQILIYLLLAEGSSIISIPCITSHLLTNIWVAGKFFPSKIKVDGILGEQGRVFIEGVGYQPEMLSFKSSTPEETMPAAKPVPTHRPRPRRHPRRRFPRGAEGRK